MALSAPNQRALKAARQIFKQVDTKWAGRPVLRGAAESRLDNAQDLCMLAVYERPDRLTQLFEGKWAFLFRVSIYDVYCRDGLAPNLFLRGKNMAMHPLLSFIGKSSLSSL